MHYEPHDGHQKKRTRHGYIDASTIHDWVHATDHDCVYCAALHPAEHVKIGFYTNSEPINEMQY